MLAEYLPVGTVPPLQFSENIFRLSDTNALLNFANLVKPYRLFPKLTTADFL
jgi:hypothetical protein